MKLRELYPIASFILALTAGYMVSNMAKVVGWVPSLGLALVCICLGVFGALEARR